MFYTTKNNLLTGIYLGDAHVSDLQTADTELHLGEPEGYDPSSRPDHGYMWNVQTQEWIDCRPEEIRHSAITEKVRDARRKAYPPIADYIDAMYWSTRGKPELLTEYYKKVDQVKASIPKE